MNQDPADLDVDGEFNAINITILEEGESKTSKQNKNQNTGCCLPFLVVGSSITGAAFIINKNIS